MKHPRFDLSAVLSVVAIVAALLLAAGPAARTAHADTTTSTTEDTSVTTSTVPGGSGDDADDDGVSDTEDNCPDVADASQDDLDGDGQGDVCDTEDAQLDDDAVVKVTADSGGGTGAITGKGTFQTTGADDDSVDDAGDVTVEVTDDDGLDETVDVSTDDCGESEDGSVGCTTSTASVKIKRGVAPGSYSYKLKLKNLSTSAPTSPVTIRIQHGAHKTDRVGHTSTCTTRGRKTICSN